MCLGKKRVPKVAQKSRFNAGKDCQEVSFERVNGAFGNILVIHVGREKFEGGLPAFSNDSLEVVSALIIHDVMVNLVAAMPEALHDQDEIRDAMIVTVGVEGGMEDGVVVVVVHDHDVLFPTANLMGKRPHSLKFSLLMGSLQTCISYVGAPLLMVMIFFVICYYPIF